MVDFRSHNPTHISRCCSKHFSVTWCHYNIYEHPINKINKSSFVSHHSFSFLIFSMLCSLLRMFCSVISEYIFYPIFRYTFWYIFYPSWSVLSLLNVTSSFFLVGSLTEVSSNNSTKILQNFEHTANKKNQKNRSGERKPCSEPSLIIPCLIQPSWNSGVCLHKMCAHASTQVDYL